MKDTTSTSITPPKQVEHEYRNPIFSCKHVLVKIPLPNKYMRFDKKHSFFNKKKLVHVEDNYVRGFLFPGTKIIMYMHYYVPEESLGKTIVAEITLRKKVYTDNRVQYILDVKPESDTQANYELKIYTEKANRNNDLGSLICIEGRAIGKIACKEIEIKKD